MALECSVATQSDLVDLDAHNIFGDAGQFPTIPDDTGDDQMTAMEGLDSPAEKQARNGRWHIRTVLNVSYRRIII